MKPSIAIVLLYALAPVWAAPATLPATADALTNVLRGQPVVVLGEVHDNGAQHALRAAALRRFVEGGARPAIAFEQFDRERQDAIDRARKERPRDVDYVITQAEGAPSWNWTFYRPLVALALEYDLPIVAANLSRADAMKAAREGYTAVFDASLRAQRKLDELPSSFLREHEQAVASGHCGLLPPTALPAMARAQIARDLAMAEALRPYLTQGVVLLAGNGHARTDVGVPHWLNAGGPRVAVGIGLLEEGTAGESAAFDYVLQTTAQARSDPCKDLAPRLPALPAR